VQKLIIAVNKMDEPTVKWSKERYNEIKETLGTFLVTCGFDAEKDLFWVPISGLHNDNIKEPVAKNVCNWYNGPTFLEILDTLEL
jgi:peptide chain release factor subunit 3